MKICFKMSASNDVSLVLVDFIMTEARVGKKYGKILVAIMITNPSLRGVEFPAILGCSQNKLNLRRLLKNRHNELSDVKKFKGDGFANRVFDSVDFAKLNELRNALDKKYPPSTNLSGVSLEKWEEFRRENVSKPIEELNKFLYEQEVM